MYAFDDLIVGQRDGGVLVRTGNEGRRSTTRRIASHSTTIEFIFAIFVTQLNQRDITSVDYVSLVTIVSESQCL